MSGKVRIHLVTPRSIGGMPAQSRNDGRKYTCKRNPCVIYDALGAAGAMK
ncbi:hypothetical protein [Agrobacterium tumefaciens]|nr:hypothetical protein [Agrobacterium tumefaciens]